MIKRSGFLCKFFALLLALTFLLGQPVSAVAGSSAPAQSTEKNEQLLSYLTGLYGEEEAEALLQNMRDMGLLDEDGNLRTYEVEVDGAMLSASEVKALVEAPGTDLTRTCKVDGQEATLQDLKTLLEIEAELQRIQSTYFSNSVTMTKEHQNAMQSLVRQLTTSGMTLRMNDSEEKDAAAVELGYKSQLAQVSVNQTLVSVEQGGKATFVFTLSKALPYEVSFDYKTVDGAATAGKHYKKASGTVVFKPNETEAEVTVETYKVNNRKGQNNVSAADYATDRWEGDRPFIIQCSNPKNVRFSGNKTVMHMQVNIQGNYTYTSRFTSSQIVELSNTPDCWFGLDSDNEVWTGMPIPEWERPADSVDREFSIKFNYVQDIYGTEQDFREYVREGLIDKFITAIGRTYGGDATTARLYIPGINTTHDPSRLVAESNKQEDYDLIGMKLVDKDAHYHSTIIYDIKANKDKVLSGDSLSYGAIDTYVDNQWYAWTRAFFIDEVKAKVTGVSAPAGTYAPGEVVPVTVTFSEPVYKEEAKMSISGRSDLSCLSSDDTCSRQHTFLYTVQDQDSPTLTVTGVSGFRELSDHSWNGVEDYKTSTTLPGVTLSTENKYKSVSGVSVDKTVYEAGSTGGKVTVQLNTDFSKWLEQGEPEGRALKASIDGGKTMINLTMAGDGKTMSGDFPLETYVDGKEHNLRAELYINFANDDNPDNLQCLIGSYADFVVEPVVFAKEDEITIKNPSEWPSGLEGVVYLTANTTTQLSFEYNGQATYPTFVWSSDNEAVAKISEDGKILPQSPGKVTFRLTATNGGKDEKQNVSVTSREFTVSPGGDPSLVIPEDINTIVTTQGSPAEVRWSTNIIYKNSTDIVPPVDTDFTVKLYEGELDAQALSGGAQPVKTYRNSAENNLRNVTSFAIPAADIPKISKGNVPSYTVTVQVKHPLNDSILTATAYILVNSPAAVVELNKPENTYLLDDAGSLQVSWLLSHFDSLNEGEFEFKVTRNDTLIDESVITYDKETGKFTSGMEPGEEDASYNGSYAIPIQKVSPGTLSDVYTVNLKAKNKNDSTWSYDSVAFYVYNREALDILVNGEKTDDLLLSNVQNISGLSSDEILALNRNITLGRTISINYGDYAWAQVTDKISWLSTENEVASINYQSGGIYDNITNYSYTTYRPSEEFILSGLSDGSATIKATHAKTGMTSTVNVQVETLKDQLYIFQASPKTKTELTYTNGDGDQLTVSTNDDGALALYEENGIVSDVQLKSVYQGKTYMGTFTQSTLASGEQDSSQMGLYPVNNIRLREPAHVVFYLKKPDGTPYEGSLTYRGGVYKNGEYCAPSEISGEGKTVTIGSDGKLDIQMDVSTFWIEGVDKPNAELRSSDKLQFIYEVILNDGDYRPLLLAQEGNLTKEDLVQSAELSVALEDAGGKQEPFIARQISRDDYQGANEVDIRKYSKKIGPSTDFPKVVIDTTVLWWGMDEADLSAASVQLVDEFDAVPSGQTYQTFKYPFGTMMVTKHSQALNENTMWMEKEYSRGIRYKLNTDESTLYKTVSVPFRVINMIGATSVIDKNGGTLSITTMLKDMMTVDGGSMSTGDAFIGLGLSALEAVSFESDYFTLQIAATQDPTVFNVLIKAGGGNMEDRLYMSTSRKEDAKLKPTMSEKLAIIKGEYKENQLSELKKNAASKKGGDSRLYYELSGYYEGQVVYNYEEGKWESIVHSGGFTVGGGMGYQWVFNASVGPIPVTAELGLGAAIAVNFNVKALYEERMYDGVLQEWDDSVDDEYVTDYLTTLRLYAYINAFGGLGFDYSVIAFKIGVFGEIALDNQNTWLNREYLKDASERKLNGQSLTLTGRTGIRFYAKFLFIKYEKILTSYTYTKTWVYNNWDKIYDYWEKTTGGKLDESNAAQAISAYIQAHPAVNEVSNTAVLEDRDYLSRYERSWNSGGITPYSLDPENGAPQSLQTNAYPTANPELTEDGKLFVYLSDSGSTDVTKTVASWGLHNGFSYTDEKAIPVDVEGYGDSDLHVAGDANGAAAVWVQQRTELVGKDAGDDLTAAEQALMANSAEIMFGLYENGQWTTKRLTDNATPDVAPVVAVNDDSVFVAWRSVYVEDQSNVTDFGQSDKIMFQRYDRKTKTWSDPDTLYNGTSGSVMAIQAAMLEDGTAAVTYTLDKSAADAVSSVNNYEIVYVVVDTEGNVVKNQQLTSDSSLDENPQITTVMLGGEEQFILGWHNVTTIEDEEGGQRTESDIRLASVDSDGNITTGEVNLADSLSEATGGRNVAVAANFRFVRSTDPALSNLSLVWATTDASGDQDKAGTGVLKAIRFVEDGGQIHTSAVIDVAEMDEGTIIDAFSAYASGDNQIKAMILGSQYTGLEETDEEVYNPETEQYEPLLLPASVSGMYTATETYEDAFDIEAVDADLGSMLKGLPLPVQFTVVNNGIQLIKQVKITVGGGDPVVFGADQIHLLPNGSLDLPVDYQVPDDKVVDPDYTVEVTYSDGTKQSKQGTIRLTIPDVGISKIELNKEEDGLREFMVTLYNGSEVELAGSGQSVKLGFFADGEYTESLPGLDTITLDSEEDISLIDAGTYTKQVSFNIKEYIEEKGYEEIPESGIPVYVKVWIEKDGKQVTEYDEGNNTELQQLYSLQKDRAGVEIDKQFELTNGKTTEAAVTLSNLKMQESNSWNAVVNLLDENGEIIESKYLADSKETLMDFGSEEKITRNVAFSQLGKDIEVVMFTATEDEMDADLSALSASGMMLNFKNDTLNYEDTVENATSTNITAAAASQTATVEIYDAYGQLIGTGVGTATATMPLQYTSVNGEATGKQNQAVVKVQPSGEGAAAKSYTLKVQNNQKTAGNVLISLPETNPNGWVNTTAPAAKIKISAEELENFDVKEIQYSLDGGTNWTKAEGEYVEVDLPSRDGTYTLMAKAVSKQGNVVEAKSVALKLDRQSPTLNGEVTLKETEIPLEEDNVFRAFMRSFGTATNRQVKITVKASDVTSGIDTVIATTSAGDSYTLTRVGDTTSYSGMITKSYEGVITVTATDKASNASVAYSDNVLIDDQLPPPQISMAVSVVTKNSAQFTGSVQYEKDDYFKRARLMLKEASGNDWRTIAEYNDAESAKNITASFTNLEPATEYVYQIVADNIVGDTGVIRQGSFVTAFDEPAKPELESKTSRAITLKAVPGAQYRRALDVAADTWTEWSDSPEFTGLEPGTSYLFEIKMAASGNIPESLATSAQFETYPLFDVQFDPNTEDAVSGMPQTQQIGYSEQAAEPAEPKRPGYTFTGWYTEEACQTGYEFTSPVTGARTLYAGWSENVLEEEGYVVEGNRSGDWYNTNVVIRPANGYEEIWNGTSWADSMTIREGKEQSVNFKLRKQVDGEWVETTFLHEPLTLSVDTTLPGGSITIASSSWREFLNTITFGLFFKDTTEVKIQATDALSGVAKTEYLVANSQQTLEALKASDKWQAGGSFTLEPNGAYVVYARVTDYAGNVFYLSSDGVIVDDKAPVIDVVYNQAGKWALTKDAKINVEVTDNLSEVKEIAYTIDGERYTTEDTAFSITNLPEGDYDVVINAVDHAGNTAAAKTIQVQLDDTAPTGSITAGGHSWTELEQEITFDTFFKEPAAVTVAAADQGSGVAKIEYLTANSQQTLEALKASDEWQESDSFTLKPNQAYVVYARITDQSGNATYLSSGGIVVDDKAPVIDAEYHQAGKWALTKDAKIDVKVTDNLSGVKEIAYTIDGKSYTAEDTAFSITNLPEGDYDVVINAVDYAGNTAATETIRVQLDDTAPTGSITAGGHSWTELEEEITFDVFFKEPAAVTVAAADQGSGVAKIEYLTANSQQTLEALKASDEWQAGDSLTLEPDGAYVVYARITDQSGNATYLSSGGIVVDATAPTLTVAYDSDGAWTLDADAAITVEAGDELAQLKEVRYTVNGEENVSTETSFRIDGLPDGSYDVVIVAVDAAGNESEPVTVRVQKESEQPSLSIDGIPGAATGQDVVLTLIPGGEYASGMALYVSKDGGAESRLPDGATTYTVTENGVYTFRLVTGAGQEATATVRIDQIDRSSTATGEPMNLLPVLLLALCSGGGLLAAGLYRRKKEKSEA
ncbi:OmpL47-type beta-barrel domain-containing protein [Hydrogeniiclostridium mannosilyticum]|uniref:OmpL47-type beta-barrel domain-containing protein n=1 Tax=Hydrogeniiclostridium mannosilyticum TaxID=2764322 RepID=UPI0018A9995C|nr:Ig-like domain-containing protein [Hydrogeniiclostridium mannosilyticum]